MGWGAGTVLLHDDVTPPVFTHTTCATTESHVNRQLHIVPVKIQVYVKGGAKSQTADPRCLKLEIQS